MSKGQIVFFDATEVRREKMRNSALGIKAPKADTQEVAYVDKNITPPIVEPVKPVEKQETKIEKRAEAAPAVESNSNLKQELETALVAFVVEQTGYPEEMVEMGADLEGDLGIDSIKKAQLLGELNEKYHFVDINSPADSDMSLDDFPTLGSIRDYLLSKKSGSGSAASASAPKCEEAAPAFESNSNLKEELETALVNFVVEQTGYPEEMVEMGADLEGDLGIDSIKKAQLLGELNEKYHFVDINSPADSDMSLDDFPTLGSIRDYLLSKKSGSGSAAPASAPKCEEAAPAVTDSNLKEELEAALVNFVVEQTGYPEEMVEMGADLEGDLGIDSIKKAQLLGELNEKYHFVDINSPADSDMSLDDFPTLGTIRDYLLSKKSGSGSAATSTKSEKAAPAVSNPNLKEELEAALVNFVVEQTGYPEEMVEMGADLEGDLGIDSIKKAQLLGELNEKYHFVDINSPADSDMSLDDFPTLGTIRDYLLSKAK